MTRITALKMAAKDAPPHDWIAILTPSLGLAEQPQVSNGVVIEESGGVRKILWAHDRPALRDLQLSLLQALIETVPASIREGCSVNIMINGRVQEIRLQDFFDSLATSVLTAF